MYPLTFVSLCYCLHAALKLRLIIKNYFKLGKFMLKIKLNVSKLKYINHKTLSLVVNPFTAHEGNGFFRIIFHDFSMHSSCLYLVSIHSYFVPIPFINPSYRYSSRTSFYFTRKKCLDMQYRIWIFSPRSSSSVSASKHGRARSLCNSFSLSMGRGATSNTLQV
jgi:hypothetical protein